MAPPRTTEIERFHERVDSTAAAVSRSRASFDVWLRSIDAGEDIVEELTVAFSELLANAVAAAPGGHQEIEASGWTEDDEIVFRVANPIAPSSTAVREPDLDDPLRSGGRGLLIVRAYTDTVTIEGSDGTIAIWCRRRITR